MSHDPFCLAPKCDYDSPNGDCFGYEDCWHRCECILISKVRADEREQAAERVGLTLFYRLLDATSQRGISAAIRGGEQA